MRLSAYCIYNKEAEVEKCFLSPFPKHRRGTCLVQSRQGLWNSRRSEQRGCQCLFALTTEVVVLLERGYGVREEIGGSVFAYFCKSMIDI